MDIELIDNVQLRNNVGHRFRRVMAKRLLDESVKLLLQSSFVACIHKLPDQDNSPSPFGPPLNFHANGREDCL